MQVLLETLLSALLADQDFDRLLDAPSGRVRVAAVYYHFDLSDGRRTSRCRKGLCGLTDRSHVLAVLGDVVHRIKEQNVNSGEESRCWLGCLGEERIQRWVIHAMARPNSIRVINPLPRGPGY